MLLLLVWTLFHPRLYVVPYHGSRCARPMLAVFASVRVATGNSRLDGGISWLFELKPALIVGRYTPTADATLVSLICGSSRAAFRSTFASIAIFTASSTDSRRMADGTAVAGCV